MPQKNLFQRTHVRTLSLAIIGLIAAYFVSTFQNTVVRCPVSDSARAEMNSLVQALDFFQLDYSRYPTSAEGLRSLTNPPTRSVENGGTPGPYIGQESLLDPWDTPYQYRYPGKIDPRLPEVWSLGSDSAIGGEGEAADISTNESVGKEAC